MRSGLLWTGAERRSTGPRSLPEESTESKTQAPAPMAEYQQQDSCEATGSLPASPQQVAAVSGSGMYNHILRFCVFTIIKTDAEYDGLASAMMIPPVPSGSPSSWEVQTPLPPAQHSADVTSCGRGGSRSRREYRGCGNGRDRHRGGGKHGAQQQDWAG